MNVMTERKLVCMFFLINTVKPELFSFAEDDVKYHITFLIIFMSAGNIECFLVIDSAMTLF